MEQQPTILNFEAQGLCKSGKVKLQSSCQCSRVVSVDHSNLIIKEDNYYVFQASVVFKPATPKCGFRTCPSMTVQLVKLSNPEVVLASTTVWPCTVTAFNWEGLLAAGDKLAVRVVKSPGLCVEEFGLHGSINIDQVKFDQRTELVKVTAFDAARKIHYIIDKPPQPFPPAPILAPQDPPGAVPWPYITIPWREGQLPPALQVPQVPFPNPDWYDKFQSVQYSVFFYLGIDMATISPTSPELTLFIKNFADRGDRNYLKKVYMTALTTEKMPDYAAKMDAFVNDVFTAVTVNKEPVLSTFKKRLVRFFLEMHVGVDDYPAVVVEYFTIFSDIIGFGDPQRPGRDAAMLFGNTHVAEVKEYFAQRLTHIIATNDITTYLYHWFYAGLPTQSILIEAIHNMVAFLQYVNTFYRSVADKVWSTTPPPYPYPSFPPPQPTEVGGVPYWFPVPPVPAITIPAVGPFPGHNSRPVNFFAKMLAQVNPLDLNDPVAEAKQLNVAREAMRMLAPNTNAFSKEVHPVTGDLPYTQARHIWQQSMILVQPIPPTVPAPLIPGAKAAYYFTYDTSRYIGFEANFTPTNPSNPVPLGGNYDPNLYFTVSPTDNNPIYDDGTLLDASNPKIIPVLNYAGYLPQGPAYRRCPGEIQNMLLLVKLLKKFANVEWEFKPMTWPPDYTKYVTLAPFTAVPDNLYAL